MKYLSPEEKEARLAKMPEWVGREIATLRRDVEHLEAKLAAGPEDSNVFLYNYSVGPDQPLGRDVTVRFYLDKYDYVDIHHTRSRDFVPIKGLEIMSSARNTLVLQPCSSNLVVLREIHE